MLLAGLTILTGLISTTTSIQPPRSYTINDLVDYAVVRKIKQREDAWRNFDMKNQQPVGVHLSDLRRLEKEFSVRNEFGDIEGINRPIIPKISSKHFRTTKIQSHATTKLPMSSTNIRTLSTPDVKALRIQFLNELEKKLLSEQTEVPTTRKAMLVQTENPTTQKVMLVMTQVPQVPQVPPTTRTVMVLQTENPTTQKVMLVMTQVPTPGALKDHFQVLLAGNNNLKPTQTTSALLAQPTPRNLTGAIATLLMAQSPNVYSSCLKKEEDETFKNSPSERPRVNPFPLELILDTVPINKSSPDYNIVEGLSQNEMLMELLDALKPEIPVGNEMPNQDLGDVLAVSQADNLLKLISTPSDSENSPHHKPLPVSPSTVIPPSSTYQAETKDGEEQDEERRLQEIKSLLTALSSNQSCLQKEEDEAFKNSPNEHSRANPFPLQLVLDTEPANTSASDYNRTEELRQNELIMAILNSITAEAPVAEEMSNDSAGDVLTISQGDNLLKLIPASNLSEIPPHRIFVPLATTTVIPSSSDDVVETRNREEQDENLQEVGKRLSLRLREITWPESDENVDIMISNMKAIYQLMGSDTWKERQERS